MKRLSSQLIITESAEVFRNSIVQISETEICYHSILEGNHETAQTFFYDGIISSPIISVSKRGINKYEIENSGYTLIYFDDLLKERNVEDKKIIIDFGTEDLFKINSLLNNNKLNYLDSIYFIIACTASPNLFLKYTDKTLLNRLLWSGTNLIDKKITGQTSVSIV